MQCDVKRGASVFDGAADERLHGGIATPRVHELDVEPLLGEMPASPRHLIGHDAEQLPAERESQFGGRGICARRAAAYRNHAGHPE